MWKCIQKGLRATFGGKGLNLGRNDVRVNRKSKNSTYCKFGIQSYLRTPYIVDYHLHKKQTCRNSCNEGQNDTNGEKYEESYGTQDSFDKLLGAFSCSGALALGWILSQPCHWWHKSKHLCSSTDRPCLVQLLSRVAVAQPVQQALPPANVSNVEIVDNEVFFGPITAEEAFEEAASNFEGVHNSIFGEVENRLGVEMIEGPRRNPHKAINYFLSASKRGYLPAFYNLAQCYEQGLGTKQNFEEAAKWYQKAAEGGHATAMYNLGVFYAHGWGGLIASSTKAREWLEAAARLGHEDALAALGRKKDGSALPSPPDVMKDWGFMDSTPTLEEISSDPEELYKLAVSYENSPCDDSSQPYLVLELYKMASDLGHAEAKIRYKILKAYNTVGLLSEYINRGTKPRIDFLSQLKFPTIY